MPVSVITHHVAFSLPLIVPPAASVPGRFSDCFRLLFRLLFPHESARAWLIRSVLPWANEKIAKFRRTNYWKRGFRPMINNLARRLRTGIATKDGRSHRP